MNPVNAKRRLIKLLACTSAAWAIPMLPAYAQDAKEINFGIISTDSSSALKKDWAEFLADMQKAVGVKINPFFATDYAGIIEGMRFNKVQVAYYGNKSAMEAVDRADAEVFAKLIRVDGSEGYNSLIISHKDSRYKTLDDVLKNTKDINFGAGDPNSTSGSLVPNYYVFAKNGINPKTDFKTSRSANHSANFMAVANKQVDIATFNTEDMEKMERAQPEMAKNVQIVWKSPLIAADPFVWRKDLPSDVKTKLKAFMLGYGKGPDAAAQKEKIKMVPAGGFAASTNDQLIPVRQLALHSDLLKVEADTTMSADDKKKKVAELNQKLDDLGKKLASLK